MYRYVDKGRDFSQLVRPLEIVDLHDHTAGQRLIRGSGPEQMVIKNNMLFVSMLHSERIEAFRINQQPGNPSQILTPLGFEFTGGITPQGVETSPDGRTLYVVNMQTEDVSILSVDANGNFTRNGFIAVGVTPSTPDPTQGNNGAGLFATTKKSVCAGSSVRRTRMTRQSPAGHSADSMRRNRAVSVIGMAGMMVANGMLPPMRLAA